MPLIHPCVPEWDQFELALQFDTMLRYIPKPVEHMNNTIALSPSLSPEGSLLIKSRIGHSAQFLLRVDDASLWDKSWDRLRLNLWRLPEILNWVGQVHQGSLDIFCFATFQIIVFTRQPWKQHDERELFAATAAKEWILGVSPLTWGTQMPGLRSDCASQYLPARLSIWHCSASPWFDSVNSLPRTLWLPTRPCSHCKVFVKMKRNNSGWVRGSLRKLKLARMSSSVLKCSKHARTRDFQFSGILYIQYMHLPRNYSLKQHSTAPRSAVLPDPVKCSTGQSGEWWCHIFMMLVCGWKLLVAPTSSLFDREYEYP